ncbi:YcxB family protein [uncultured Dokdonia sp.]|uniref:YcxB family protein n=1 Tax=uncultured Dokdonia sp. TaxID=575653 RepID=UPI002613BE8F|nr:YcxB family protein [uncultured Dokdonia sp.]
MRQITTHPYRLDKERYFNLLVKLYFKKKWYLIVLIAAIVIYNIPKFSEDTFARFFVIFGMLYIPLNIYRIYRWVYAKSNANYFIESTLTVDNSFLYFKDIAENETKISVATFVKMTQTEHEYLLYLSQNNFSYIPKSAFKTDEDRAYFELVIKENITT